MIDVSFFLNNHAFKNQPFISLQNVAGKALVSVQLQYFVNPSGRDYDGGCCDGICGLTKCDNWFVIRITELPQRPGSKTILYKKTNVYTDNDDIKFPFQGKILTDGSHNPLRFTYDGYLVIFFSHLHLLIWQSVSQTVVNRGFANRTGPL